MKILVIQLRRIGDILLTTPVLPYLKAAVPGITVDFLAEPIGKSVLETNPYLNELLIYDKKRPWTEIKRLRDKRFDVVLDFMNNPRTSLLSFLSGAETRVGFGCGPRSIFYSIRVPIPKEPEYVPLRKIRMVKYWLRKMGKSAGEQKSYRPELYLTEEDERFASQWMSDQRITPKSFVVMAPAHRHPIRQWRWEGFRAVGLRLVKERNLKVYLAWGPGEEELMEKIRAGCEDELGLLPMTTMRQMGAVFRESKLVVTNDSGAMHLAVSVKTPTVTVYGPTRPIDWNPSLTGLSWKTQDIALTAPEVECLGCHRNTCPVGHLCMQKMSEERVIDACERLLKEN